MGKRNTQVKPVIDLDNRTVSFEIADGKAPILFEMDRTNAALKTRAALVGFAQVRIVDKAAVGREDDAGNIRDREAMLALKREAIQAMVDHLHSGTDQWELPRGQGGGQSIRILAIQRIRGYADYATAKQKIQEYADRNYEGDFDEAIAFLGSAPKVMDEIARIQKERLGAPKVDADAALDEME